MSGNLNLYDFNGSIKRNKLQDAIFSDMAKKDDFIRKLNEQRNERLQQVRERMAAIKIQSVYRGYRSRKQFCNWLRQQFDEAGPAQNVASLQTQILRLAFFHKNATDYYKKTLTLCAEAVKLAQTANAKKLLERRRRLQLLRCSVAVLARIDRTQSYTAFLRFIEIYLKDEDCINLMDYGFYPSIMSLFSKHHELPSPLYVEKTLPQHAEALLQILILPIRRSSRKAETIFVLYDSMCKPQFEAVAVCCIVPFLIRMCKSGTIAFVDIINALSKYLNDSSTKDATTTLLHSYFIIIIAFSVSLEKLTDLEKVKLAVIFAAVVPNTAPLPQTTPLQQSNVDSDSEDDSSGASIPTTVDMEPEILTAPFYLKHVVHDLRLLLSQGSFASALLKDQEGLMSLCTLTYFISLRSFTDHTKVINFFLSFRHMIPSLWCLIKTLKTKATCGVQQLPVLTLLQQGQNLLPCDEHSLIPVLSMFGSLMTNLLKTVDDDDFQSGGVGDAVVPLTLSQIAEVVQHYRDLTLGLIDLAFPINTGPFRSLSQCLAKNSRWSRLFQNVIVLTRALHERDNRVHFMPRNFWSSHNRQVVVNSSLWQGRCGYQRRMGRPFEFVRFLLPVKDLYDKEDTPSANELRNISIIRNIPFVVPFMQRIEIFTELLIRDRFGHATGRNGHHITVRRGTLYEDAFAALKLHHVPDIRSTIRVQMVNWIGMEEVGVDGGGIFREFLSELLQTALDPSRGFFATTHEQLLYPNPAAPFLYPTDFADHFFFIGRIIAKLIYEGLLADVRFADFFLLQWINGSEAAVLDLELVKSYDPLLHKNLKFLKRCSPEEIEALDLDFSVLVDNFGATTRVELKRDGSNIKVTTGNRMEYIQLYVNYHLSKRLSPMTAALRSGLKNVLNPEWLRMFSPMEISMLIGGVDAAIDFNELKKVTVVHNIKSTYDQQYVDLFWLTINEFTPRDKKKLLKFITGCPRPPIMGFKVISIAYNIRCEIRKFVETVSRNLTLTPPMGIQLVHDVEKLPTAATCMNLLKLPLYKDAKTLRSKLIYAINSGAGFELS